MYDILNSINCKKSARSYCVAMSLFAKSGSERKWTLVEPRIVIPVVAGSSPVSRPIIPSGTRIHDNSVQYQLYQKPDFFDWIARNLHEILTTPPHPLLIFVSAWKSS